jgi:small conductance mechanosensitive channel
MGQRYWEVYWDLTRAVKLRFDQEGITIPAPQREVRLKVEKEANEEGMAAVGPRGADS